MNSLADGLNDEACVSKRSHEERYRKTHSLSDISTRSTLAADNE